MNTKVQERQDEMTQGTSRGEVAHFQKPRLPWNDALEERFADIGITKASWKALVEAVFPNAQSVDSIVMALSYCKARRLDPFKRPVHIVPVYDSNKRAMVETVWPGISELRTTAMRTGQMAGMDAAEFGEMIDETFEGEIKRSGNWEKTAVNMKFPQWCQITVYRMLSGQRVSFVGPKVYWREAYASQGKSTVPNAMWQKRPQGQLEKCAEAAALRRAFPEELGNEYAAEEMEGQRFMGMDAHDVTPTKEAPRTAAAAMDAFSTDSKRAAEDAEIIEEDDAENTAGGTDEPGPDDEAEPEDERQPESDGQTNDAADDGELSDDDMAAAVEFTRKSLADLSGLKTRNAVNVWYDTTFIPGSQKHRLSKAQVSVVDGKRKERLSALK